MADMDDLDGFFSEINQIEEIPEVPTVPQEIVSTTVSSKFVAANVKNKKNEIENTHVNKKIKVDTVQKPDIKNTTSIQPIQQQDTHPANVYDSNINTYECTRIENDSNSNISNFNDDSNDMDYNESSYRHPTSTKTSTATTTTASMSIGPQGPPPGR